MANKELTALPAAGALTGTSVLYLVDENNNSRKVALSDLAQWIKTAASIVPASNPWKGARVRRTADLAIANNVATAFITWQAADINTNAFWSAGAPTRFTVPAGVTKVKLTLNARWSATASVAGVRQLAIFKNGVTYQGRGSVSISPPLANQIQDMQTITSVVSVVAGDYFEALALQTSGAALNIVAHESTWFEIEVVEG